MSERWCSYLSNKSYSTFVLDEIKREREFYKARNLPCPKDIPQENKESEDIETKLNEAHQESDYHRMDEQVNLCLECSTNSTMKNLKRRFIRCSSQATITQLKKFVAKKVFNGIDKYREVGLLWLTVTIENYKTFLTDWYSVQWWTAWQGSHTQICLRYTLALQRPPTAVAVPTQTCRPLNDSSCHCFIFRILSAAQQDLF